MINQEVYDYNKEQLIDWLRNEAGSSNPDYFHSKKTGGMKLQQVPEEYAQLLLLLKEHKPKTYLELGIGNGGSFATACFFMQENIKLAVAVDSLEYGKLIDQNRKEVLDFFTPYQKKNDPPFMHAGLPMENKIYFSEENTDSFFLRLSKQLSKPYFDVIFIDADHSYEGVRKDFVNAQKHINEGGLIIFHDIASQACPGIMRIWSEIKAQSPDRCIEFIHSNTCGIGVVKY
jgi:predicted O-methyltransferase YrrM